MTLAALVSVFDISDDEQEFAWYLAYLHAQGLRGSRNEWLKEAAQRLMGLGTTPTPQSIEPEWTLNRRRLLVTLTWPDPYGGMYPQDSYVDDDEFEPWGYSGLAHRKYRELWGDIGTNLEALASRAHEGGLLGRLTDPNAAENDIFLKSAKLGLIETVLGEPVAAEVVEALRATAATKLARAEGGFLVTWWDVVAIAEAAGLYFEPLPDHQTVRRRESARDGRYLWDRGGLIRRWQSAELQAKEAAIQQARQRRDEEARRSPQFDPIEVHRRISAGGRINPPRPGTKYGRLFEFLDGIDCTGEHETVTLSREQLDEFTSAAVGVSSPQGGRSLPMSALRNPHWWYGPWNPEQASRTATWRALDEPSWTNLMLSKSQTRAWMAAGLRASPNFGKGGGLESVTFRPVTGRRFWWPYREELRASTYSEVIELSPTEAR